jgi:ABC-2 type transport system ATP-binding protein
LENLNLDIPYGCISAFLGPNGAGKTTAIRILLGLLRPDSGNCEVLGYPPGHPDALRQIGAMVETPSLYPNLTGWENVEITRLLKDVSASDTNRVLALVGLEKDARRQVRTYSLGMRQRLGIALALLGTPKLLILDEPTNGLDPAGILEMRELIHRMPRETDSTVCLSSHLLAEVEQVADHLVVIHKGKLRYQGALADFGDVGSHRLMVRVGDPTRAMRTLDGMGLQIKQDGKTILVDSPSNEAPRIATALVEAGIELLELTPLRSNLEARFLALVEAD